MISAFYDFPSVKARKKYRMFGIAMGVIIFGLTIWVVKTLFQQGLLDSVRWDIFSNKVVWNFLFLGLQATIKAAFVAGVFATILAILFTFLRSSTLVWVRVPVIIFLELFRGIPVLLLIFFVLLIFGAPPFVAVVAGLSLYNAAIISEIFRAGIQALPKGQREASLSLGLTKFKTCMLIEFPQAVRWMFPSLLAQFVVLLKDTSLGYIVSYPELLRNSQNIAEYYGNKYLFSIFFVTAAIYIILNMLISKIASRFQNKKTKLSTK